MLQDTQPLSDTENNVDYETQLDLEEEAEQLEEAEDNLKSKLEANHAKGKEKRKKLNLLE
jgi:hypothetical protein